MIVEYFRGIWQDRHILYSLVNKDLQTRYRRSKLGVAWAILTPVGLVLIIGTVYSILFGADPKTFIPMLFAGLSPWLFVAGSADGGTQVFMSAEGYLRQTSVNAQIFPLRCVIGNFVNLLYSVVAFFVVYLFLQPDLIGPKMLMIFPSLLILFFFVLSLANIAAVFNLNVRDYAPFQSLCLQALFYATPIIYDSAMLRDRGYQIIYQINPFHYMIDIVRRAMTGAEFPPISSYLVAIGITCVLFLFSVRIVMKSKKTIVFKL